METTIAKISPISPISPVNMEARKKWDIRAGDTIKVWQKIKEKDKVRLQLFEGLVLAVKHGKEAGGTFTVRKIASGVGVEKIFPVYSPVIDKIEIVKRAKVRQAKLYHIRRKAAKEIQREMRNIRSVKDEEPVPNEEPKEAVTEKKAE
ncbi:MAG: 50S ribosomal protein L19 [Candidatus Taylorbacteria bacterium]